MKAQAVLLVGVVLAMVAQQGVSWPSLMLDNCDRALTLGTTIMGNPVTEISSAPANQQHGFTVEKDGQALACGSTVQQGDTLVVKVDSNLVDVVAADTWQAGAGPHYLVEATKGIALVQAAGSKGELGCPDANGRNSRATSAGVDVQVIPVAAGQLEIRLVTGYVAFGTVYLSDVCTFTAEGTAEVTTVSGFLVDNLCWERDGHVAIDGADLDTEPWEHSLHCVYELEDCKDSGYAILQETSAGSGEFERVYKLNAAGNEIANAHFQSLIDGGTDPDAKKDLQYTVTGFANGDTINVLALEECAKGSCDAYYDSSTPSEGVCIDDDGGLCIESSVLSADETSITITLTSDDAAWFAMGITTSGGGMTGGGGGADAFLCSADEGIKRYWMTSKTNPFTQTEVAIPSSLSAEESFCEIADGAGRMIITRTLAAGANEREIVAGTQQDVIWARGPSGTDNIAGSVKHRSRGTSQLDLTAIDDGVTTGVKMTAQWTLWLHLLMMVPAWGILLPMGVAIANRTRDVEGAPKGAWFKLHKVFQRAGWTLQLLGLIFAAVHCEKYSVHFEHPHTIIGLVVVIIGTLQPINAMLRPHPPPGGWGPTKPLGRVAFEIWHKGMGWAAVILGMINVILGAALARRLDFNTATYAVPLAFGCTGIAAFVLFMGLGLANPNNALNKALTGASSNPQAAQKA